MWFGKEATGVKRTWPKQRWLVAMISRYLCALLAATITFCGPDAVFASDSPLVKLAGAKFPNLTHAERALLEYADRTNLQRGNFAVAGATTPTTCPTIRAMQTNGRAIARSARV
jgi:hypothetical protein